MAKEARYTEAVGRRKTATARVRITEAKTSSMLVNGKMADEYFPLDDMVKTAFSPLTLLGATYAVSAHVQGGGRKYKAGSIRLGLSRAMIEVSPEHRKDLKVRVFLKRDPRAKERKKF